MNFLKKFLFAIFGFFFIIFFSTTLTLFVLDNTLIVAEPYQSIINNYGNNIFEDIPIPLDDFIKDEIILGLNNYIEQSIDFVKEKRSDINVNTSTEESQAILDSFTTHFDNDIIKLKSSYKLGKLIALISLVLAIILIAIIIIFSRNPREIISWISTNLIIATLPIILVAYLTKYLINNFILERSPEIGSIINTLISNFTNTLLAYGVIFLIVGIILFIIKFFIPHK